MAGLMQWPMYFAKRPLEARRMRLTKGDQFPIQEKQYIRNLALAYGLTDGTPFHQLDYVEALDVQTEYNAKLIRDRQLTLKDARRLVQGIPVAAAA